jgi:uncharacterized protein
MDSVRLLHKYQVPFVTLSCVNRKTALRPLKVYRFLRDKVGAKRMQFIPIVEPKEFRTEAPGFWSPKGIVRQDDPRSRPGHEESIVEDWCVDPYDWGHFLSTVFDEWMARDLGDVYVNLFDSAVEQWMGRVSPLCIFGPMCGKGIAVEHDGSVFSCDHYVYPEYRLGNIMQEPLLDMAMSKRQESFGYAKEGKLPNCCRECDYQFACFGECPKNRFLMTSEGEPGLNYLCRGFKRYFSHIDPHVQRIARQLGAEKVMGVSRG